MIEPFVYNFQTFLLILARIIGLFSVAPFFSSESISFSMRMIISFLTALILFPVTAGYLPPVPGNMTNYALLVFSEIIIGVLMGFLISIIFAAFQVAGEFFSVQIGFGYAEILDPISQSSLPVISTLKNLMGLLLFLIVGAHRIVFESLAFSFEKIRIISFTSEVNNGLVKTFQYAIGAMFLVAFKIALPVLGIIFLVTVAEALMGKAAPQLNILQLSFPIKVLIGLLVIIAALPFIEKQMIQSFDVSFDRLNTMLSEWPGQNQKVEVSNQ